MTKDESLKLALGIARSMFAADDAYGCGYYNDPSWRAAYRELRKITQEALAHAPTEQEQPAQQEPVAWLTDDERKALERFNETCEDGEGYDVPKPMMKRLAEIGVIHHTSRGIYGITKFGHSLLGDTTPPQRKPLTDEEMWKLWNSHGIDEMNQQETIAFARAIEAAHGIKE